MFQEFNINVPRETYAITGNDAIIKCEVPSFVTDLVSVIGWTDGSEVENIQGEILSGNNQTLLLLLQYKLSLIHTAGF